MDVKDPLAGHSARPSGYFHVVSLGLLIFLPASLFMGSLCFMTFLFKEIPSLVWLSISMCLGLSLLLMVVRQKYWFNLGVVCFMAILVGTAAGLWNYQKNMDKYWAYQGQRTYTGVPSTAPAVQRLDAGKIAFTSDSVINNKLTSTLVSGRTYCVAPIVTRGATGTQSLQYWAAGADCATGDPAGEKGEDGAGEKSEGAAEEGPAGGGKAAEGRAEDGKVKDKGKGKDKDKDKDKSSDPEPASGGMKAVQEFEDAAGPPAGSGKGPAASGAAGGAAGEDGEEMGGGQEWQHDPESEGKGGEEGPGGEAAGRGEDPAGFLIGNYRDGCRPWEAIVLLRKMALAIATMLAPMNYSPGQHIIIAQAILMLALIGHFCSRPYKKDMLNQVEGMSLTVVNVALILAAYVTTDIWSATTLSKQVATIAAGMLLMGWFVALICLLIWAKWTEMRTR